MKTNPVTGSEAFGHNLYTSEAVEEFSMVAAGDETKVL